MRHQRAYTYPMILPETDISPQIDVYHGVQCARDKYVSLWQSTPGGLPDNLRVYKREEQEENEARLRKLAEERQTHARADHTPRDQHRLSGRTLRRLAKLSLAHAPADMKDYLADNETFIRLTEDFVHKARGFDPGLPKDSLLQALRNIWVFCSLQRLAGRELRLTPSAFAYSLLYPYTDNVFDDHHLSPLDKRHFAERVGLRLKGKMSQAVDPHEERVFSLVGMIEEEFPREDYPLVHESLEAIHRAQQKSTTQQSGIDVKNLLPLTLEKGGTSVLADAFLANVVTDENWFDVSFSYGCILQLIDDLQDAEVDYQHQSETLFSIRHSSPALQELTTHLLGFIYSTIAGWTSLCISAQDRMKEFMRDSCQVLVLEAVARRSNRYPAAFLNRLEQHAPTRMVFLASLREIFPES
jgi:hypothetical protein